MKHKDIDALLNIEIDLHNGRKKLETLSESNSDNKDIERCNKLLIEALDIISDMRQVIIHKYGIFV